MVVATGSDTAGSQWIEAKVLLNTMQCTEELSTNNCPAPNNNRAEAEKPDPQGAAMRVKIPDSLLATNYHPTYTNDKM